MTNYEKRFNAEIIEVLEEAEKYGIKPSQINWLKVFYHAREKVNEIFVATGV